MWWLWTRLGMMGARLQEEPKCIVQGRIRSDLPRGQTTSYAIMWVTVSLGWKLPSMLPKFLCLINLVNLLALSFPMYSYILYCKLHLFSGTLSPFNKCIGYRCVSSSYVIAEKEGYVSSYACSPIYVTYINNKCRQYVSPFFLSHT